MSLPELLEETLDGEEVRTHVPLGGEDVLAVTSDRTAIYRGDGLLSDESVQSYNHGAERVDVSVGRRKAKIGLNYGLDGEETIALPAKHLDDALAPIMTGVLAANGIIGEDESVQDLFRFSDLTLIVTDNRLVKQIGSTIWDESAQTFDFESVTDLAFEEGSVATSVVLTYDGRRDRFKIPNDDARAVRESLSEALCSYHGVETLEAFRAAVGDETDGEADSSTGGLDFDEGLDPLGADPKTPEDEDVHRQSDGEATIAQAADVTNEPDVEAETSTVAGKSAGESSAGNAREADGPARGTDGPGSSVASDRSIGSNDDTTDERAQSQPLPESAEIDDESLDQDLFEGSPFESAGPVDESEVTEQLKRLTETVETQGEKIEQQTELLQQLIAELRRGR